jgi:hypothetical protein
LPKKSLEYHKQLVKNYRKYREAGGRCSWLGEKIYRYSLSKTQGEIKHCKPVGIYAA